MPTEVRHCEVCDHEFEVEVAAALPGPAEVTESPVQLPADKQVETAQ